MSDDLTNPAHYTRFSVEPINAIESWGLNFRLANVVKYVARAEHKGHHLRDLQKARWYLDREIAHVVNAADRDRPADVGDTVRCFDPVMDLVEGEEYVVAKVAREHIAFADRGTYYHRSRFSVVKRNEG